MNEKIKTMFFVHQEEFVFYGAITQLVTDPEQACNFEVNPRSWRVRLLLIGFGGHRGSSQTRCWLFASSTGECSFTHSLH